MSQLTSAGHAPEAPPAAVVPVKSHGRDESLVKTAAINVGLVFLITAFVALLAMAGFVAVFVAISAFAPS